MTLPGLTKDRMMMVDRMMIEDLSLPVELMMEHAGSNLARLAIHCATKKDTTFRIIVGSGNNGAGGMVAARRLAAWGYHVEVYAPRGVISFRRVPAGQYARLHALDIQVMDGLPSEEKASDVVLDAYLGYGFVTREDPVSDEVFQYLSDSECAISFDVPSGMNPDSGEGQESFRPNSTLTIAFVKEGLLRAYPALTGDLFVCDIGVPIEIYRSMIGLPWQSPFTQESLLRLVQIFQENSMASVQVIEQDGLFGWLPDFVPK